MYYVCKCIPSEEQAKVENQKYWYLTITDRLKDTVDIANNYLMKIGKGKGKLLPLEQPDRFKYKENEKQSIKTYRFIKKNEYLDDIYMEIIVEPVTMKDLYKLCITK